MAGIARQSLALASHAIDAQNELQRRWAITSCQQALLGRAETILTSQEFYNGTRTIESEETSSGNPAEKEEEQFMPGVPRIATTIRLGEFTLNLVLADEDSKANLNTLYRWRDKITVQQTIRRLNVSSMGSKIHMKPYRTQKNNPNLRAFDSWGQVFELDRGLADVELPVALDGATHELTCWGRGQLNVHRASDQAIQEICLLPVGPDMSAKLIEQKNQNPGMEVGTLLDSLKLGESQREQLEQLLTDQSMCHSLWIHVSDQRRTWHTLTVAQSREDQKPIVSSFQW